MNLDDPNLYLNRELSWLDFNERVLEEAFDKENPVLERLKFLSITSSNLDEFFMIRVAGLKEQEEAGYAGRDPSGMTATEQLKAISIKVHELVERQNNCLHRSLLPALKKENIFFLKLDEFDGEQKEYIERYFIDTVYPVVTPMAIDQSRPFPFLQNRSINLGVVLEQEEQPLFAVVQIPPVLPRLIKLPSKRGECFTFMGDILKSHMNRLFSGYHIRDIHAFRITRNADLSIEEEDAHDLLIEIEKSLQRRRWGFPVRLEIERGMNVELREYLKEMLELADEDIYVSGPPLDLTLWMKFLQLKAFDNLRYPKALPQASPDLYGQDDLFKIIRDEDTMLHHPFESFQHISDLVYKAAEDPRVLAIKQTLYRVSGNSPIIDALVHAADNGKQVTVLVEIKARFDEESNIQWAKTLERAGCHVVYGLVGLKTHVKMLLVVREEDDGIRRYLHLSTGNYNDTTARLYTDIGLLTVRDQLTTDASALFNVLTGYSLPPRWKAFAVAPYNLRETFLRLVQSEIDNASRGYEARIIIKINSLLDEECIKKLYEASIAGVRIDLIVRGICCLKSGIEGVSDNIRVISVVGRYLEHSRIFYFQNRDNPKFFLSSADLMPRNLDRRIEVMFPVEDERLRKRLKSILEIVLKDTVKARLQFPDGKYKKVDRRGKPLVNSQEMLHKAAISRLRKFEKERISELASNPVLRSREKA